MRSAGIRNSGFFGTSLLFVVCLLLGSVGAVGQAQVAASDLRGTVVDPNGAVVPGAIVTARNIGTGITRTATSGEDGTYTLLALPPGEYEVTAEAPTFKKVTISPVRLTVGQSADLRIPMEVGAQDAVVTVTGENVELIETSKTSVASTIDQAKIESLPINQRDATGFALTLSTVGRDNGRPIGPAPTSGLNIGGQRGRSTQVNVDGADFTDNSINAARSTVSMEAVQEYQVATNSYTAEFGRATGGVINVVTKRGTNQWHGSGFGFIRDKRIQSTNAFSPIDDPDYRRTQYGFTLGGPILKERTFIFAGYERRVRDESGFFTSDVAQGLTASLTVPTPFGNQTFANITPAQATAAGALLGNPATASLGLGYLYLASGGATTGLTGSNPLLNVSTTNFIPLGQPIGSRFFLSGTPVPISDIAFRPLNDLLDIFPVTERANYFSARLDHNIDENNLLTMRVGYNTGNLTGIQVESQNQSLGQNDFSRTGITTFEDLSVSTSWSANIGGNSANEFRINFGERESTFRSQNNDAVAYNISGTAFIGRELFSPVDRTEERWQIQDNFTWATGNHTFKFGADFNWIEIPSALFELNFAGLFNFGELAPANLLCSGAGAAQCQGALAAAGAPNLTPVQTYGLGFPSIFIQGFGDPISRISNKPIAFFAQDSWRIHKNLVLNYGVRYDVELTAQIAPVPFRDPLSGINLTANDILAAQDVMGVQQGIPRDKNNWAPRLGFAWDIFGDQKTKLSGSFGMYYDHPLLALAFNSDIADAAQQQQSVLTPGSPSPTALFNAAQVFHGTVCGVVGSVSSICGPTITPGVAASAQYQFGRQRFNDQTFTGFGAVLPFVLPVAKDFQYASAAQGNLTFERQLTKDMALSASYIYVQAHHLNHPTDLNTPDTALQIQNFQRFFGGALPTSTQQAIAFSIPTTAPGSPAGVGCGVVIPGMVAQCPTGRVVAPAIANFFRPNAPNYFLAQALSGGAVTKPVLDSQLAGSLRTPGLISPFGSINAQISDGNSTYNALRVDLNKRFSGNFMFLASYTWSHTIDDSSDLQTLLIAQDVRRFDLEKANALFDQRHRFVFSGALYSPASWRTGSGWQKVFSDFTVAPIIEISSGRPFNIITNVDTNNDQSTQTDRPSVNADGTLCLPGDPGCITPLIVDGRFAIGNLGRNMGLTHGYMSVDLGITRAIRFNERVRLDLIAQGFNLFNRFNEASSSPLFRQVNTFNERAGNGRYYSIPTAAYDARQFQFGAKFIF